MGIKFYRSHMISLCFHLMGNHISCVQELQFELSADHQAHRITRPHMFTVAGGHRRWPMVDK
uniref:Uncharacterized protein n=1 Tax=Nelumbo nucifera TaxID=4432 RepID=A0A822YXZ7_NELNU|nr:TPA_asm: hypothetical protein HUJ06_008183 [Nelumbo nucifera]